MIVDVLVRVKVGDPQTREEEETMEGEAVRAVRHAVNRAKKDGTVPFLTSTKLLTVDDMASVIRDYGGVLDEDIENDQTLLRELAGNLASFQLN